MYAKGILMNIFAQKTFQFEKVNSLDTSIRKIVFFEVITNGFTSFNKKRL